MNKNIDENIYSSFCDNVNYFKSSTGYMFSLKKGYCVLKLENTTDDILNKILELRTQYKFRILNHKKRERIYIWCKCDDSLKAMKRGVVLKCGLEPMFIFVGGYDLAISDFDYEDLTAIDDYDIKAEDTDLIEEFEVDTERTDMARCLVKEKPKVFVIARAIVSDSKPVVYVKKNGEKRLFGEINGKYQYISDVKFNQLARTYFEDLHWWQLKDIYSFVVGHSIIIPFEPTVETTKTLNAKLSVALFLESIGYTSEKVAVDFELLFPMYKEELFERYQYWCNLNEFIPVGNRNFIKEIKLQCDVIEEFKWGKINSWKFNNSPRK